MSQGQSGEHLPSEVELVDTVGGLFSEKPEDLALVFTSDQLLVFAREFYSSADEEQTKIDAIENELFAAKTRKRILHSRGFNYTEAAALAKALESQD